MLYCARQINVTYLFLPSLRTKCIEKQIFAQKYQLYPETVGGFFNICLGAEIFELKVQRANVRREVSPNGLLKMFLWELSRFLLRNIKDTVSWNPGKVFYLTGFALPLLDCRVNGQKISKCFMLDWLDGAIEFYQIGCCTSKYEIKFLDKI